MAEATELQPPRLRRTRTQMNAGDVPLHEYPGPSVLPPLPKGANAEERAKHKAKQARFEINKWSCPTSVDGYSLDSQAMAGSG